MEWLGNNIFILVGILLLFYAVINIFNKFNE